MDNPVPTPAPAPIGEPTPAAPPIETPPVSPAAPLPVMPPSSSFSSGGILSGVTVVGVGMMVLTCMAFFYSIYYHRKAIENIKIARNDMDEIKANLKSVMGDTYKSF